MLRTGEVADRAGVNVQTLRYYERRGLLAAPDRSIGGHRLYPPDTVALLQVIKAAQRLGFTLDEVAELIDAGRRRHPAPDLRQRAVDKIAEIDSRIAHLSGRPGAGLWWIDVGHPATVSHPVGPVEGLIDECGSNSDKGTTRRLASDAGRQIQWARVARR